MVARLTLPTCLQHVVDELLEIDAPAAVGVEFGHQAAQLVLGKVDVETAENLCKNQDSKSLKLQWAQCAPQRACGGVASSSSDISTFPLLSRSRSSKDLRNSPPDACDDSRCAIFVRSICRACSFETLSIGPC